MFVLKQGYTSITYAEASMVKLTAVTNMERIKKHKAVFQLKT